MKLSYRLVATCLTALLGILTVVVTFTSPAAAYDNDYPTSIDGCRLVSGGSPTTCNLKDDNQDKWVDPWGEYNRECTSFVAWRLASRNGYTMPFHDNASGWKADADARKIPTDNTPAVGAVAWFSYDHLAWVEAVSADSRTVTIEEYNYDYNGHYNERTVSTNPNAKGGVTKFIHFMDLASSSPASPTADGNYISYHGAVYRIAGGAPLYVSSDDATRLPDWTTNKPVSDADWASLRAFPKDGMYITDVQTGAVYITAGGAPMYISGDDTPYLPGWAHALPVPHWDFVNWQHLRQYPADGYYLRDVRSGFVYNTAGGVPFYVTAQDAPALPQWQYATPIPHWEMVNHQHLRNLPADGTYITDVETGAAYITLGGAPMYISGDDAPFLPNWAGATRVSHWEFQNWSYLRPYPVDGYYLRDVQTNAVYVTAGGAPLYISAQDATWLPQWQYASPVPHWELQHWGHLKQLPADGTFVKGAPSGEVFRVMSGAAARVTTNPLPAATTVDDWAIVNQLGGTL